MRERTIEKAVSLYAKASGWLSYKFTGQRSVPDRLFIKNGLVLFVEFKAPSKKPTALQQRTINTMIEHGAHVFVIDDIDKGKKLLNEIHSSRLPTKNN